MTTSDGPAHLLSLKVMRVSRPSLASAWQPFYSSSPSFSAHSTQSILSLQGKTPLPGHPKTLRDLTHATELLTLPSSFGSIQLGETFSSCLSVNNESAAEVEAVSLKVEMQTVTSKVTLAELGGPNFRLSSGDTMENVVSHEIKELGQHVLACTVSYRMPMITHGTSTSNTEDGNDPSIVSFRKFYKFAVTNPLSVKTKVHAPRSPSALLRPEERDKVFLEVHIQNLAPDPIWFERMRFESVEGWDVKDTDGVDKDRVTEEDGLFSGSAALMQPQDMRQHIYILHPKSPPLEPVNHAPGTIIPLGRLDISWRSSYGEPGRLLTSMLSRRIPLPPQTTQTPASALPPYLKRQSASSSTPSRPRSPQLPQSRPSSPPPSQRPGSPFRSRPQSVTTARTQSPPPTPHPISMRTHTIEANLVLRDIPRDSIKAGKPFITSFTLVLSSLLPPERRGQNLRLSTIVQHVYPLPSPSTSVSKPAPEMSTPTPKVTSPGFSTPSPVYSTFNYALAYQKLAASQSPRASTAASRTLDGDATPRNAPDNACVLPPPHYDQDDPKRLRLTGGVSFIGPSAIALPPIDLVEQQSETSSDDAQSAQQRVYAQHDFELAFMPSRPGFHNVGGLRLLLTDELFVHRDDAADEDGRTLRMTDTQVLKEWDVIAEIWVS
ncbi:hypothetical protein Moror_14744 [Moniliophthora roreri MCA 2997]|uniref:DUF974-domain-containing protein n=2 Tax=Moniliophthora roreri TaxID=221103 RepID=V2X3P3_MONRO|nr:hypothetical protein Moror_14744 [Moniliophthora roreri MCA 2997]KAI3610479.1 hypothetical protein WG66_007212 [Moniliophthora roreri]